MQAVDELQALQDETKKTYPQKAEAIDQFLLKLKSLRSDEGAFTFILDDPVGNNFIENLHAPSSVPLLFVRFYERSREQQATLCFLAEPEQPGEVVLPASAARSNSGAPWLSWSPWRSSCYSSGFPDEVAAALCRYADGHGQAWAAPLSSAMDALLRSSTSSRCVTTPGSGRAVMRHLDSGV